MKAWYSVGPAGPVATRVMALRGSAEEKLLLRYTRQLDEQENKLEALRREIAATTSRRDAARQELNVLIERFSYEG